MNTLPDGLAAFLAEAGWEGAAISPLPGDASFRRYFRISRSDGARAMLMHAPPPHEDPAPFLAVARWLSAHGMRAPAILAAAPEAGFVLTEDFGNDRMRDWLETHPGHERAAYEAAVAALAALHRLPPGPFPPYDMATYQREAALFVEWYCPAQGLEVDTAGFAARQQPGVTVLRDYHAENIMLLSGQPGAPQGLIDFQDALVGHPAYDLVSLLQDARRDVPAPLEAAMLAHYAALTGADSADFHADYARLGAQRNAKIVGIFTRLERDLAHPALAPVARWFDANIPSALRAANGAMQA
jgi:aminoglycoside/choline kinase family phosphotransferase